MVKVTYKVGLNGGIDESKVFAKNEVGDAISLAKRLWDDFGGDDQEVGGCEVAVYGYQEYSDDDKTPLSARTTFWRHWRLDNNGKVHADGR